VGRESCMCTTGHRRSGQVEPCITGVRPAIHCTKEGSQLACAAATEHQLVRACSAADRPAGANAVQERHGAAAPTLSHAKHYRRHTYADAASPDTAASRLLPLRAIWHGFWNLSSTAHMVPEGSLAAPGALWASPQHPVRKLTPRTSYTAQQWVA
jgi:hypothetical protein